MSVSNQFNQFLNKLSVSDFCSVFLKLKRRVDCSEIKLHIRVFKNEEPRSSQSQKHRLEKK